MQTQTPSPSLRHKQTLALAALALLYAWTRLFALTDLPIFSDEAIYIHWAQIILSDPAQLLISMTDGKPPLFMWLNAVTLALFDDPLVAGRMVSILAGWAAMLGVYFIGRDLFSPRAGLAAALLYVLFPYTLFFDRLALVDGLLTALGVWSLRWAFHIVQETRDAKKAFRMLGVLWGLMLWTKASALLWIFIPLLMFPMWGAHRRPGFWMQLGVALSIPLLMNAVIYYLAPPVRVPGRLPFLHHLSYFIPLEELVRFPFMLWIRNLWVTHEFFVTYLTWPIALLLLMGLVTLIQKKDKRETAMWSWLVLPGLMIVLVAQGFFSRYFLPMVPAAALIAGFTADRLAGWLAGRMARRTAPPATMPPRFHTGAFALLLFGAGLAAAVWDARLLNDPRTAPLHELDRLLYVEGMNSGYGVKEAADYLREEAVKNQQQRGYELYLMIPRLPGNPAEGITVYLFGDPNVVFVPAFWWPEKPLLPDSNHFTLRPSIYELFPRVRRHAHLLDFAYFVYPNTTYPQDKFLQVNPSFHKEWSHPKPDGKHAVDLFQNFTEKLELELPTLGKR
ncbi:ArnT family glycosyltransferase [Nitrospina gracilis]|uniref:ArnT family glycosyltransferase n=1 Tax=Nitrospina gracilis TaxID=35801 RepID=UPI001F3463BB|nr:glycosyltransferase family 39 protein [Nitrospina gracilis]MCF8721920.1 4-amino-4-deoxy-L-arabinose transferase-like glycosyltransferase [Nitrospina gracilis Nb-211]